MFGLARTQKYFIHNRVSSYCYYYYLLAGMKVKRACTSYGGDFDKFFCIG
jgi:hypothetical protein